MSTFVIDCAENYVSQGVRIRGLGASGVIRYFNPLSDGHDSGKSLTAVEAKGWADLNMPVGVVVEGWGGANGKGGIDRVYGTRDADKVVSWLPTVGFALQPRLVVWFAVDTDASAGFINQNEVSYFDAVRGVFQKLAPNYRPRVGIYGSGWSCLSMVGTKRADEAWIAGSPGWAHYRDYVASNGWRLLQHIYPGEKWNSFEADTNAVNGTISDAGLVIPFRQADAYPFRPSTPTPAKPLPGPTEENKPSEGFLQALWNAFKGV